MVNFKKLQIYWISIVILPAFVTSISLDSTGSYKLVVAIDEKTAQNAITGYVENIKTGIQALSDALHSSLDSKFSIQEVDIVVPSHWDTAFDSVATTQYYQAADVKISHVHPVPSVDNPNPCARPGSAILLPYNFFDDPENSKFGDIGKALLTQFARLRFGVWEEHGLPGDLKFPYFRKTLTAGSDWEVNSCTDSPIFGDFRNIEDDSDCSPTPGDEYPPVSQCRFLPSGEQTATSSIMSYHYLESVGKFCDARTHDKQKPTPHNLFCRYKSITEIIQQSSDWKHATQPINLNPVIFKVVKNSASPLLYFLLDGGISPVPSVVLSQISSALINLVEDYTLENVLAVVGTYPPNQGDDLVTEIVPWTPFRDGRDQFITAFNTTLGRKTGLKNFGGGLKEAVRIVTAREHPAGAVVLMVKTGIEPNTGYLTSESDVLTQVLGSKVKIYAIEVQGSEIQPSIGLKRVVSKSEGIHFTVAPTSDLMVELGEFMKNLAIEIQSEIKINRDYVLVRRDVINRNGPVDIKVNSRLRLSESFVIPLSGVLTGTPKFASTLIGNQVDAILTEMTQWGTTTTSTSAKIYYFSSTRTQIYPHMYWDQFQYTCNPTQGECRMLVYIFAQAVDMATIPSVELSVSTSAENSVVDMTLENSGSDLGTPFAIYAQLKQDRFPLMSSAPGFDVFAYVTHADNPEVYAIRLTDDGLAAPDVSRDDGIFSGTFVPKSDGLHNIIVTAQYRVPPTTTSALNTPETSSSVGKLFPVDQIHIGCGQFGCSSIKPTVDFIVSQSLPRMVDFKNVDKFKPIAHRVIDFSATPLDDFKILLEWTVPGVYLAEEGLVNVDSYSIKHSDDFYGLLNDFDNAEDLFPPDEIPPPGDAWHQQSITFTYGRHADQYFALKAKTSRSGPNPLPSVTSVIIGANVRSTVIPTTTTTTTSRPITTSRTPAPTTRPPGTTSASTTEGVTTESVPTSPRTTKASSTTPRTTTPPTTPLKSTPSPFPGTTEAPIKHWFETTEGIITLSVFGGALLTLIVIGGGFYIWITKYR